MKDYTERYSAKVAVGWLKGSAAEPSGRASASCRQPLNGVAGAEITRHSHHNHLKYYLVRFKRIMIFLIIMAVKIYSP